MSPMRMHSQLPLFVIIHSQPLRYDSVACNFLGYGV